MEESNNSLLQSHTHNNDNSEEEGEEDELKRKYYYDNSIESEEIASKKKAIEPSTAVATTTTTTTTTDSGRKRVEFNILDTFNIIGGTADNNLLNTIPNLDANNDKHNLPSTTTKPVEQSIQQREEEEQEARSRYDITINQQIFVDNNTTNEEKESIISSENNNNNNQVEGNKNDLSTCSNSNNVQLISLDKSDLAQATKRVSSKEININNNNNIISSTDTGNNNTLKEDLDLLQEYFRNRIQSLDRALFLDTSIINNPSGGDKNHPIDFRLLATNSPPTLPPPPTHSSVRSTSANTTNTKAFNNYDFVLNKTSSLFQSSNNPHNNNTTPNSAASSMFHPTWDEWKRAHSLNNNSGRPSESEYLKFKQTQSQESRQSNKTQSDETKRQDNIQESSERHTTTRNYVEETFSTENNKNQQKMKYQNHQDVYNPPSSVVVTNNSQANSSSSSGISKQREQFGSKSSNHQQQQQQHQQVVSRSSTSGHHSPRTPHYPVYPFDRQPQRAPSPVHLSSIVLAKEPPLEVKTENTRIEPPPPPPPEPKQPTKIKTILSTRKDSAPSLTGWRTDSESDTDTQNRLLAKATGSIPIEYISIRRDPKPVDKKPEKGKKSITTGTNTSSDRGKKIASTNTSQDELPQYNLHVSLDSMYVKSRREASTSTDRMNRNAATETDLKLRDAGTVTDIPEPVPEPPPPPPVEHYFYRSRKSRVSEWESNSEQPTTYRLEFLTKSPRLVHRRVVRTTTTTNYNNNSCCADNDDRIIFGGAPSGCCQQTFITKRSGSFPSLMHSRSAHISTAASNLESCCATASEACSSGTTTKRYYKRTNTTNLAPQYEMNLMPLSTTTIAGSSNGFLNCENMCQNFNTKLNEIFGSQQQHHASSKTLHHRTAVVETQQQPKVERFYKYSRTTNALPGFGEIYHQYSMPSNSTCCKTSTTQVKSSNPMVEVPVTPCSTINKSHQQQFFSSNSRSNSRAGGFMCTSMSPAASQANIYVTQTTSSGFEPFIKKSAAYSKSEQNTIKQHSNMSLPTTVVINSGHHKSTHRGGREEEDEEVVNVVTNSPTSEMDRQFRPIFKPNESSTNSTPIMVTHTKTGNQRRQNYSTSSYNNDNASSMAHQVYHHQQPFYSTQTIAN